MSDPFGIGAGMDAMRDFLTNREPDIYEAKARIRKVLLDNRSVWITEEGVSKRASLSPRATVAALSVMQNGGVVRKGKRRDGISVWRWAS